MGKHPSQNATIRALPKLCGADIELGNFIAGMDQAGGTGYEASRALLAEIKGLPVRQSSYCWTTGGRRLPLPRARVPAIIAGTCATTSDWAYNPQDVSRRFLASNGGSAYIDLDHAELCLPEVMSAFDHVAAWHGMLRIMRAALDRANEGRPADRRIQVLVNNSDGQGNSYGSHSQLPDQPAHVRQHLLAQGTLSSVSGFLSGVEHSADWARQGGRGEWPALDTLPDQPARRLL